MEPISLGEQKFIKTDKGWVDAKSKQPAPAGFVKTLDIAYSQSGASSEPTPPLPSAAKAAKTARDQDAMLKKLTALTIAIQKLTKLMESQTKKTEKAADKVPNEPGIPNLEPRPDEKIPQPLSFKDSLRANFKDALHGQRDAYGRVTKPGFLRNRLSTISPTIGNIVFGARDRRRDSIAQGLMAHERNLRKNNPNMDPMDMEAALREKRHELKGMAPSTVAPMAQASAEKLPGLRERVVASRTGEEEERESVEPKANKYAAAKADAEKMVRVELADIGESALSKLREIFNTKENGPAEPEEDKPDSPDLDLGGAGGGKNKAGPKKTLRERAAGIKKKLFGSKNVPRTISEAELVSREGKPLYGAARASKLAKLEKTAAAEAAAMPVDRGIIGNALEKGKGLVSKIPGMGGKGAGSAAKVAEKAVGKKAGLKLLGKGLGKSVLKKLPGVSLAAGLAFGAGRLMKGDLLGAGGEVLSGVAGTIPGLGTAASVGIDAALAARDMAQADQPSADVQPAAAEPVQQQNVKPAVQVQPQIPQKTATLMQANRTNNAAKLEAAKPVAPQISSVNAPQTIVNNSTTQSNMPTVGPRGSLDLSNYA